MATSLARTLGRDIETLFSVGVTAAMSDEQLLELFLGRSGDDCEDAFSALVKRHGPMVWRVCRRSLADPNDAEDAFQVTFLVLARKARSIAHRPLLANWLYGVAVRSAKDVKAASARRRIHDETYRGMARADAPHTDDGDAILAILDIELARLPEIFRAAILLCDLEGRTHEQAARALGVPAGTVASRLSRGRARLREGLERRGFTGSTASIAAAVTNDFGALAPALVARTANLAAGIGAGRGATVAVPALLHSLATGVIRSMLRAQLTSLALSVVLTAALAAGAACALAVARRPAGADDRNSVASLPAADAAAPKELAWIDGLANADAATKVRLKRCLSSALANFAAIRRATYEFDFRRETAVLNRAGEPTSITAFDYTGKLYWRDGLVHYEFVGPRPMPRLDPQGQPLLTDVKDSPVVVIRLVKLLAITREETPGHPALVTEPVPEKVQVWRDRHYNELSQVDPLVFYARCFRTDEPDFRKHCEAMRAIQSAEGDGTILLRFRRADDARIEIICDKAAGCLPTRWRVGRDHQGQWRTWGEDSCEWRQTDGVWFPAHQLGSGYIGTAQKAFKPFDLTIRNARFNEHAQIPKSVFDPRATLYKKGAE